MEKHKESYKNNKFKILAPTLNDKFKLLDQSYSVLDIQNYSYEYEYNMKNMKYSLIIIQSKYILLN